MLITLNGESRAGKDSVAGFLVANHGFRQVALATKIRDILLDLDPLVVLNDGGTIFLTELYSNCSGDWDQIKAMSKDSVEWMIALGQSLRNRIDEDVWLNAAFPECRYGFPPEGNIVVSDIRQPNEVEWVRSYGGEIWHIERPGTEARGMDNLLKGVTFDAHILNDGTLESLEEKVTWLIESRG